MIGRPPRSLSQRNYLAVMKLHAENEHLRQIDRGLVSRPRAAPLNRLGLRDVECPIHVGKEIEAVPTDDGWAA